MKTAQTLPRGDGDRGGWPDHSAPVATDDWIEAARQAFLRRYYAENGDDYENSPQVYGDTR